MSLFNRKKEKGAVVIQASRPSQQSVLDLKYRPISSVDARLYDALRQNVPIIDAAINKTVRLIGDFEVLCSDRRAKESLDSFLKNVRVGLGGIGINSFIDSYINSLLTYGNAAGEILVNRSTGEIAGLYNANITDLAVESGKSPVDRVYYVNTAKGRLRAKYPQYILFSALNPPAASPYGVSVLRGLPSVSAILLRIYECMEQNFDRVGNVRYAVTYKPSGDMDKAYAKERAKQIASEWSQGMAAAKDGQIRDFVAVGDVDIKVIGADNKMLDTEIPVRQLLEQIVAKLAIPPFMLGLSWNVSERMSAQQADILTSELEFYRRQLTPVINQIARAYLASIGSAADTEVKWESINLQDEVELANARLANARAAQIEENLKEGLSE